jgi:hypothetical protein
MCKFTYKNLFSIVFRISNVILILEKWFQTQSLQNRFVNQIRIQKQQDNKKKRSRKKIEKFLVDRSGPTISPLPISPAYLFDSSTPGAGGIVFNLASCMPDSATGKLHIASHRMRPPPSHVDLHVLAPILPSPLASIALRFAPKL